VSEPAQIRPTTAHVDLARLAHNYRVLAARFAGARLLAPVKGDAYGHGLTRCALALEEAGCDAFGVALVEEGRALRRAGVRGTVLCLGGVGVHGAEAALEDGLTPMLYDLDSAAALEAAAARRGRPVAVHLKVDTGMGRLGVPMGEWEPFLDRLANFRWIRVEGLVTHFAESESADRTFTREQLRRFRRALAAARVRAFEPRYLHVANSGAALTDPETHYSMVRPGIALYGYSPTDRVDASALKRVMRVTTRVLFVKNLPQGASVSYGRRWIAPRPTRLATLPVGYADGYPRALSGRGEVVIHGRRCPIRGAVCMDLTMVDITDVPAPVRPGDEVELLGDEIGADEVGAAAGTISYEILARFSERVPRRFGEEG
jgi:alanine racemase